jgi:hypothetical protein
MKPFERLVRVAVLADLFAASEQPELFATELRAAFRTPRGHNDHRT